MNKPDFVSQTAESMTPEQKQEWFRQQAWDAFNKGATWNRFSHHPEQPDLLLYEGWKVRPDDEGEPHFQFQAFPLSPTE